MFYSYVQNNRDVSPGREEILHSIWQRIVAKYLKAFCEMTSVNVVTLRKILLSFL